MDSVKSIFASKTFWGAIVAVGAGALSIFHYQFSAADQAQAVELITGIGAGLGGIIAIVGRVVASKQIGSK